jgi:esterase/lipase superfamily enzyme
MDMQEDGPEAQNPKTTAAFLRQALTVPSVKYAIGMSGVIIAVANAFSFGIGLQVGIFALVMTLGLLGIVLMVASRVTRRSNSGLVAALISVGGALVAVLALLTASLFTTRLPKANAPEAEAPAPPLPPKESPKSTNAPPPIQALKPTRSLIRVFYATDRAQASSTTSNEGFYLGQRGDSDVLSLGTIDVSIPRDHRMGEIERPSILRFEFREDPEKHIVIKAIEPEPEHQFFNELQSRVAESTERQAFVFVHGYAVTFADAARRTAQLAYDLGFDGAPILYSWPSRGKYADYPADEATIEWTTPHLKVFLEKIADTTHAKTVHLIAHSMGNRALTASLKQIATEHGLPPMFKQVFLAAPDIDIGVFKQLAEVFPNAADHVTLYASSKDEALVASKKFHKYPRAGDTGTMIAVVPHVDTIDATSVDTGLLGHSYYGDNRSILTDIFYTIRKYETPDKRFGMRPNDAQHPTYWLFRP